MLPEGFEYVNHVVRKGDMGAIVDVLADAYPKAVVAQTLDALKNRCFRFATKSGLTVSVDDVRTPADKQKILDDHEKQAEKVEDQFRKGSSPTVSAARRKWRSGTTPRP